MDLLFHPAPGRSLKITSGAGLWFCEVRATELVTCSRKQQHTVPIKYRREMTSEDEGAILDAFEMALRYDDEFTVEQKNRAVQAAARLADLLVDELLYSSWVDPCIIPS